MRLYSGSARQFLTDTAQNQIAGKLEAAFFAYYRYHPSNAEVTSWRESLRAVSLVFHEARLVDNGVILEYQLPMTSKRLDCLVCGRDQQRQDSAVIIELKQWERCQEADGENEVLTWVAGAERELLHPAVQVGRYRSYLKDTHTAFYEGGRPIALEACAYLHNYRAEKDDVLYSDKYRAAVETCPVFTMDDTAELADFLQTPVGGGAGLEVLSRIEEGQYRPSRRLMDHVSAVIRAEPVFTLLDEQLVVYDKVLTLARRGFHDRQGITLIVKGGPGTGKSVIAINLMADLLKEGYNTQYATGSKAFTTTLRKVIGPRGAEQIRYFNSYVGAERHALDVLVCDEAHRIREHSADRFTPRADRPQGAQVDELLNVAKVSVFFIDDQQVVRPGEVGSSELIKSRALAAGNRVLEYQLEAQFRCKGSEAFVSWLDNTLGIARTAHVLWNRDANFDFQIMGSPQELEEAIRGKVAAGHTGRLVAGYCWHWARRPRRDGTLEKDVVIGSFRMPWNARPEATRLARGIPKANLWAYDPGGIDQIGCIYTAQGFEFDYVGVIFGNDLRYNLDSQRWVGQPENSHDEVVRRAGRDRGRFAELAKRAYRVLLSRGLQGCYVYFVDKDTERFFRSRMETPAIIETEVEARLTIVSAEDPSVDGAAFRTMLPVYSLAAAAGGFSVEQASEVRSWVVVGGKRVLSRDMFVAQVRGRSMEPKIRDGDYCVFRLNPAGTRQGKILLVRLMETMDQETGGRFTVKRYRSDKAVDPATGWCHIRVTLEPLNSEFKPIIITAESEGAVQVVAELVEVLGQ